MHKLFRSKFEAVVEALLCALGGLFLLAIVWSACALFLLFAGGE